MPDEEGPSIELTERFQQALVYAFQLHRGQVRKKSQTPYIAHLLGVTGIVLEDGGDEDQAIVALLHDAVEDQGGVETLEKIRQRFGNRVATIVDGLTDSYGSPKPPWRPRKEAYLDHLKSASPEVRRVSLADKLHNARTILFSLKQDGEDTWNRFKGGKQGSLWYYRSLVDVFQSTGDDLLTAELAQVVGEIEALAASQEQGDGEG
jgi:(p)ppGpp synthase/HD superfamily hydrolase